MLPVFTETPVKAVSQTSKNQQSNTQPSRVPPISQEHTAESFHRAIVCLNKVYCSEIRQSSFIYKITANSLLSDIHHIQISHAFKTVKSSPLQNTTDHTKRFQFCLPPFLHPPLPPSPFNSFCAPLCVCVCVHVCACVYVCMHVCVCVSVCGVRGIQYDDISFLRL